jgi:hypothetical protein
MEYILKINYCEDEIIGYNATCKACRKKTIEEEMEFNLDDPYSGMNNLTTPCCFSLICPSCISNALQENPDTDTIKTQILFITEVIYFNSEENFDESCLNLEPFSDDNDNIQYNWVIYKPIKDQDLKNAVKYNKFGSHNIDSISTDICAVAECKKCNFKCSARIYMDS